MAKYTRAEVFEKMLRVRAGVDAGRTLADACKAAGVSTSTYTRWLTTHASLDLPSWVVVSPARGAFGMSGDGARLFAVSESVEGLTFVCRDAATGVETARAFHEAPRGDDVLRNVLVATGDARGARLGVIVSGGAMFVWDVADHVVTPVAHDLREGCVPLTSHAIDDGQRWTFASLSPDLTKVAFWEAPDERSAEGPTRVVVRGLDDGEVIVRHEYPGPFMASPLLFHPTRPLLAYVDDVHQVAVLDLDARRAVIERGPMVHAFSFGPRGSLVFSDWHGDAWSLDLETREIRPLHRAGDPIASQRDRFVIVRKKSVSACDLRDDATGREITLENIVEAQLSRDGNCLAVLADRLCVWDFGPSGS